VDIDVLSGLARDRGIVDWEWTATKLASRGVRRRHRIQAISPPAVSPPAQLERDRAEHQGRSDERAGPERLAEQ
jgi:hypothetical protein